MANLTLIRAPARCGNQGSEERYAFNNGKTQEAYGPAEAERLLHAIGFPSEKIAIVKPIIGTILRHRAVGLPRRALLVDCGRAGAATAT